METLSNVLNDSLKQAPTTDEDANTQWKNFKEVIKKVDEQYLQAKRCIKKWEIRIKIKAAKRLWMAKQCKKMEDLILNHDTFEQYAQKRAYSESMTLLNYSIRS